LVDGLVKGLAERAEILRDVLAAGGIDGAVPVQEAKWARLRNRAMSPTSARIRAAPAGPMPWMSLRCEPLAATAALSSAFIDFSLAPGVFQVSDFPGGHAAAGPARQVPRPHRGQQCPVLGGGLRHRDPARDQFGKQPVHPVQRLRPGPGQPGTAAATAAAP